MEPSRQFVPWETAKQVRKVQTIVNKNIFSGLKAAFQEAQNVEDSWVLVGGREREEENWPELSPTVYIVQQKKNSNWISQAQTDIICWGPWLRWKGL